MKRYLLLLVLSALHSFHAKADHITGGEMYYTYVAFSGGMHEYSFTLKLYMRCNSGRTFPNPAIISIFDKTTNQRVLDLTIDLSNQVRISLPSAGPCINNPPDVCYEVGYYNFNASLPPANSDTWLQAR